MNEMSLERYSGGKTDTSVAARKSIDAATVRRRVFEAIKASGAGGMTSNQIAATLAIDYATIQPRTSELRRDGLIEDSGLRRQNEKGKSVIVWRIAE